MALTPALPGAFRQPQVNGTTVVLLVLTIPYENQLALGCGTLQIIRPKDSSDGGFLLSSGSPEIHHVLCVNRPACTHRRSWFPSSKKKNKKKQEIPM